MQYIRPPNTTYSLTLGFTSMSVAPNAPDSARGLKFGHTVSLDSIRQHIVLVPLCDSCHLMSNSLYSKNTFSFVVTVNKVCHSTCNIKILFLCSELVAYT